MTNRPCQTSDNVSAELQKRYDTSGLPWRKIAALPEYLGIPAGTLCAIAKGATIPVRHRVKLGLPAHVPTPACPECGVVHTKGHPHPEQRRGVRLVTQVTPEQRDQVRQAAEAEGVTVAEWIRRLVEMELQGDNDV